MAQITSPVSSSSVESYLGDKAEQLLGFSKPKISRDRLHLPGPDMVDRIFRQSDRNNRVLANLQRLFDRGRLAGTGYVSILPVDQGIEHSAGASFAKNPDYFDPEKIIELAIEGGCNAVASTFGVLGIMSRAYAHKIPFIVKINHNELLTVPNRFDQVLFGTVKEAYEMGAAAVAQPFTLDRRKAPARLLRSATHLLQRTIWAWLLFSGAISATLNLRKIRIITFLPT